MKEQPEDRIPSPFQAQALPRGRDFSVQRTELPASPHIGNTPSNSAIPEMSHAANDSQRGMPWRQEESLGGAQVKSQTLLPGPAQGAASLT